jgi:hypothetical protein
VDAAPGPIVHCHCETCRKIHGSAFSSVSSVRRDRFRWTKGRELFASYESSPGKFRHFGSRRGSHIVAERTNRDTMPLRLGCLDTPILDRPKLHIWRSGDASWFDPIDPLPDYQKLRRRRSKAASVGGLFHFKLNIQFDSG